MSESELYANRRGPMRVAEVPLVERRVVEINEQAEAEYRYQVFNALRIVPQGPGWINLAEIAE